MHGRRMFFWFLMCVALLIAGLHYLASTYYLYFEWWWFDILMHVLGGVLIGGASLWFLRHEVPIVIRKHIPAFLFGLVAVLVVGVLWEVFEFFTGMYFATNYTLDTTLDLLSDIVGMLIAYILTRYAWN